MTLATRCTACGTIFRVVQDQLRVSNGWVRCGRCGEAFNAVDAMVDLPPPRAAMPVQEPEAAGSAAAGSAVAGPPPAPPPEPAAPDPAPALGAATVVEPSPATPETGSPTPDLHLHVPAENADASAAMPMIELPPGVELIASDGGVGDLADLPRPAAETPRPASTSEHDHAPGLRHESVSSDAPMEAPLAADGGEPPAAAIDAGAANRWGPAADAPPAATADLALELAVDADERAPSFVVAADRAARWRRPGVRLALGLGVLAALLGLAGQGSYVFRDRLAAQAPPLRPWLLRACAALDCRVGDVRQIDALSVESSGLVRVEGSPVYRLSVTLRNRATFDVAAPALDLSLTDAQGQLFARRVFTMADLDLPLRTLKAGSELPIQVPLGIKDRAVSGYTVEIFYP